MATTAPAPSVTIFGPTGFIGREIVPAFLSAVEKGLVASLSLATRDVSSLALKSLLSRDSKGGDDGDYGDGGVKIVSVSFDDRRGLVEMLRTTDVVVSCMGTQGDYKKNKNVLVEACAEAGVKVYVPSEFGTDHRNIKYENQMFGNKQHHHAQAEKLGLKVVAIYTGLIMETAFTKWLGFDTKARTWHFTGSGEDAMAITSQRDLGPLILHAVLLAIKDPSAVPSNLRVYSENRTIKEYKTVFESVSGETLKLELTPVDQAEEDYEKIKHTIPAHMLGPLIPLLVAQGSFDHESRNAREIVNPGQKYFRWKTIEEYAHEVKGLPWETGSPF